MFCEIQKKRKQRNNNKVFWKRVKYRIGKTQQNSANNVEALRNSRELADLFADIFSAISGQSHDNSPDFLQKEHCDTIKKH